MWVYYIILYYVIIYHIIYVIGRRLCGNPGDRWTNFTSSSNVLTVHFVSNSDGNTDRGFLAQYNAVGSDSELNIGELSTWAIQNSSHGGRETILWTELKEFFEKTIIILCLQTNLKQVLYKIQQIKFFEEAAWLIVNISWEKMVRKTRWGVILIRILPTLRSISRMTSGLRL